MMFEGLNKEKLKELAAKQYEKTKDSVNSTKYLTTIYGPGFAIDNRLSDSAPIPIKVTSNDTASELVAQYKEFGLITVLNFASYTSPGGGFIKGSRAQEECLCHESNLYALLAQYPEYYEWNKQHLNNGLYLNRALFIDNVLFRSKYSAAVITCAAPNLNSRCSEPGSKDIKLNKKVLRSRIKFILDIAYKETTEILILGAFGCGVFGQDPKEVATIFKEYLTSGKYDFKKVVFAIPGNDGKREIFEEVFK